MHLGHPKYTFLRHGFENIIQDLGWDFSVKTLTKWEMMRTAPFLISGDGP